MTHTLTAKPNVAKRVLHIITGLGDGGAESTLYRLCTHDRCDSHYVISLTTPGKYGELLELAGVSVIALNMRRGRFTVAGLIRLWKTVRHLRPDVINTWMYHANFLGGIVGRLAGTENVVWGLRHSHLKWTDTSLSTITVSCLCAILSRWIPKRIVSCAELSQRVHVSAGYDLTRMVVIPNGYDLSTLYPNPDYRALIRQSLGIDDAQLVIGYVARYTPIKDHTTLLRALHKLRSLGQRPLCLLVGSDISDRNTELSKSITDLELTEQVFLLGPRSDIPQIMNALDLHVMSSSGEAFPNVLAEAMACGTPCVSTNVGDAKAILGDDGWLVPASDSVALAYAIHHALDEVGTEVWINRKINCRIRIQHLYSIDVMLERYRLIWFS